LWWLNHHGLEKDSGRLTYQMQASVRIFSQDFFFQGVECITAMSLNVKLYNVDGLTSFLSVLYFMTMKEAIKTSVLSCRWEKLRPSQPYLNLDAWTFSWRIWSVNSILETPSLARIWIAYLHGCSILWL
jgi:hypothetical protein